MKFLLYGILFCLLNTSQVFAASDNVVGHLQSLKGSASFLRGKTIQPANVGGAIYLGDVIKTGKDGSLAIILTDETTFSLGPNSELAIKDYAFSPNEGQFGLLAKMVKGTFSYVSGLIAKLSPNSVHLEMPNATIAVRGTKLLVEIEE